MTPRGYVLTRAAEAEMSGIIRHARREWGDPSPARRYIAKLEQGTNCLAAGQGSFKKMGAPYPALRMVHCERHHVFCLPRKRAPALIVAILHERMDLMARLADRL